VPTVKSLVRETDLLPDVASVESIPAAGPELEPALVARARVLGRLRPEAREALVAWTTACAFVAVAVGFLVLLPERRPFDALTTVALVAAFALASQVRFEVGNGFALPTQLVFVPMALALPARTLPAAVAVGLIASALPRLVDRTLPPARLPVVVFSSWYSVGPAAVLAAAGDPLPGSSHWPVYLLALAAQFGLDYISAALWGRAAYGVPIGDHLRQTALLAFVVDAALSPLGFVVGLEVADRPLAILIVLPLVGLLGYFARERRHRIDHALELSHAYRGTALLLGDVIEADDAYTGSHSRAVVELTVAVAERLGLDPAARRHAELTALLHDVGKVRIPAAIINKPGPLDVDERALMNTHTIEGERMLEQVGGLLGRVGRTVRSCHEHWDGGGYPDGLAGERIPLVARIVSCCDAYNAMTTDRSYRAALSEAEARNELVRVRGTQFDPNVVDALLAVLDAHDPSL
jgi:HD-GYP domain-containing protein (c-di-GMP phosphodiesterase class II)